MIKWVGYGKSLKLLFFGLLISCFIFLGNSSVSAVGYQLVGLTGQNSPIDSNYQITFLKGGGVLTNLLGTAKGILAFRNDVLFFWATNGFPYTYLKSPVRVDQGYFDKYLVCDLPLNYEVSNCSLGGNIDINNNSSKEIFINFFKQVLPGDEILYDYVYDYYNGATWSYVKNYMYVCFGSQSFGKSLCFVGGRCTNGVSCSLGGQDIGGLTNSLSFTDLSFSNISYNYFGPAPGQNGYGGSYGGSEGGSSEVNNNLVITGDFIYSECTVGQAKKLAEDSGLNPYVCYAGLNISDTGLQIGTAGTGSSVFELFQSTTDGKNFRDWFDYRDKIFDNRYVYSNTIRQDKPSALYSYFNFYNQYGPEFTSTDIENYCRIIINNLSESSKRTGLPSRCPVVSLPYINDGLGVNFSGEFNGNVAVGVNRNGVGNMSGNENTDAITFIQNFFNKAKSVIPTDYNGVFVGVLPSYIILFLCALILFRFISH